MAGAAPGCRFASYRCGNSSFSSSALVAAIQDAVAKGARVISMSWGSTYDDPAIRSALQAASDAGCLLVAAAGNDASSTPFYPAALPFVLAVGASNSADPRASFSNFGTGWTWPRPASPSTPPGWPAARVPLGTSMACPLVAGAGVLLYGRLGSARRRTPRRCARRWSRAACPWATGSRTAGWTWPRRWTALPVHAAAARLPRPGGAAALRGTTVTVTGSGLWSTTSVTVAGQPVSFDIVDGAQLTFVAPDAPGSGPAPERHTPPLGTDTLDFSWVETNPAARARAGAPRRRLALRVVVRRSRGRRLVPAARAAADTFTYAGHQILVPRAMLHGGNLGATGLADCRP